MIKIAVPGINGRMGQAIAQQVLLENDLQLSCAKVRAENSLIGSKVANSDLLVTSALNADIFDVMIDFTLPLGVMEHLDFCRAHNKAMVIGATGFNSKQINQLKLASQDIAIVQAANMSIGINKCFKLLSLANKMFDENWQVCIEDLHHQHKKDSPSGTAKQMSRILGDRDVKFASERRGEVIGEHSVTFSNDFEKIVIAHVASDRTIYAQGAIMAARWIYNRPPGFYSMLDVIE